MDTIVSNIYKTFYGAESPFIPIGAIINSNKEDFGEIAQYSNNSGNSTRPNNTTVSNNSGNSTVPNNTSVSNNSGNSTGPNNTTVSNNSGNSTGPNNTTVSKDLGSNISSSHPSDKVADTGENSNMLFYIMIIGGIVCFVFILILIFLRK
jgi:cobalamin biosynthesis Mg chelatase CobN